MRSEVAAHCYDLTMSKNKTTAEDQDQHQQGEAVSTCSRFAITADRDICSGSFAERKRCTAMCRVSSRDDFRNESIQD